MIKIEKFLEWVNNNNMHILLNPCFGICGINKKVATLRESRYSGAFGHITKSMDNFDLYYQFESFGFLLGDSGRASLCSYGKNDKEAIFDLCLNLLRLKKDKSLEEINGPVVKICNGWTDFEHNKKIDIPKTKDFL